ncbi:MAG TPA: CBS domain-containing protein [Armatimonadota bacterium]|nr:CBS domain-containing protein [Armatimonadota bacterium]HOQ28772.1 CBS domain-containing protein [Armatimonadota bacterium]HPO72427.1 CBS domain-containing protein [Armatimonadota bacterium]HPT99686.1 CBS domain-containing protein [Armatimonadota bacterium]
MLVRDVMTPDPVACMPDDRVETAAKIMMDRDCGAVPIVDSQEFRHLVGIVTDRDIVMRLIARGRNPIGVPLHECMTTPVFTVRPDDTVEEVARVMQERQVRRVPVIDSGNVLVGIVAMADLARASGDEEMLGEVLEEVSEPVLTMVG